jgi:F-type H+-transporting ATPase subunit b
MKFTITIILILVAGMAHAASGGHGQGGIPTREIFWQVFNLGILLGAMFYFLRQPTKDFFRNRQAAFVTAANKSQAARMDAEKQFLDIKHKIEHLETTRDESIARAEAEAVDLRKQILKDAEETAVRVRQEAEVTATSEAIKARKNLQEQFVAEAVSAARGVLSKDIGAQDHGKLQTDFVRNVQGVTP